MTPSNATIEELVCFVLSLVQKALVIFTVVMYLFSFSCVCSWWVLFLALLKLICLSIFVFSILFVLGGENSDYRLEEKRDVVERMNFKLFIISSSEMSLDFVIFHKT
jgi:hypothetical protein